MSQKSKKPLIPLTEIIQEFEFVPKETIKGGINGVNFYFPKGVKAKLTYPIYEALLYANQL